MSAGVRKQVDIAGWTPREVARRTIEQSDIDFCRARPGQPYSALAHMLRVNECDLRDACQRGYPLARTGSKPVAEAGDAGGKGSRPPRETVLKAGTKMFAVFAALADHEPENLRDLAEVSGVPLSSANVYLHAFRKQKLIEPDWSLTEAGWAELATHRSRP